MIREIEAVNKPCGVCKLPVNPDEWHIWDTTHLVRLHIECGYGDLAHKKNSCKFVERNEPSRLKQWRKDSEERRKDQSHSRPNGVIKYNNKFLSFIRLTKKGENKND